MARLGLMSASAALQSNVMGDLTPSLCNKLPQVRQDPAWGLQAGEQLPLQWAAMELCLPLVLAHLSPSFPGQGVAGGWDLGICRINDTCSEVSGSSSSSSGGKLPVTSS